jgi:hypothetical protein
LIICDPVRIRVIFTKYLKVNIPHCRPFGTVTNGSQIRIDKKLSYPRQQANHLPSPKNS